MNDASPRLRHAHLLTVTMLVALEYLQNVMASFSSSYIMGGIGAAPEEFSLATAGYAAVAVVMLFKHRVLVQALGYRRFILWSLMAFALGALISGFANNVPVFMLGRMVQALGGSAFFTGARVQVNHHRGAQRLMAIKYFAMGIFLGSGLAPVLGAYLLEAWGWRSVFMVMVPLSAVAAWQVLLAVPAHEPVEHSQPGTVHPVGTVSLVAGIFLLQFVLERVQYDVFASESLLWVLGGVAVLGLVAFVWHDWQRHDRLIAYPHFVDGRFLVGLTIYAFCYVLGSVGNYMTPVFLGRALGFSVTSNGWLLSATSLVGVGVMLMHLSLVVRHPRLKHYLWFALAMLFSYGWWMSGLSAEVSQSQLFLPLLLYNGVFLAVAQGTAAFGTFRNVDEEVFSHAYQVKNVIREVANASGVSIATVILQMRSASHYQRLAESTASLGPWYGNGVPDPLGLAQQAPTAEALAKLGGLMTQQATLMACQDYFWGLCIVAVVAATALGLQKKFA